MNTAYIGDIFAQEDGFNPSSPKLVVRIKTSIWHDNNGVYSRKSMTYLKRKSNNIDGHMLLHDLDCVDAGEVIDSVVNFNETKDGIYELILINISRDYETGHYDSWNYKLTEYKL